MISIINNFYTVDSHSVMTKKYFKFIFFINLKYIFMCSFFIILCLAKVFSTSIFSPLNVCASSRDGKQSGDFQHISTHSFIYFHFKCDWSAHGLLFMKSSFAYLCLVEFDKVETAHKGFLVSFHLQKGIFSSFFIWSEVFFKKKTSLTESHLSSYLSSCYYVYSLFMCVVSCLFLLQIFSQSTCLHFSSPTFSHSFSFQSGKINDHVDDILTLEVTNKLKNWKSM